MILEAFCASKMTQEEIDNLPLRPGDVLASFGIKGVDMDDCFYVVLDITDTRFFVLSVDFEPPGKVGVEEWLLYPHQLTRLSWLNHRWVFL